MPRLAISYSITDAYDAVVGSSRLAGFAQYSSRYCFRSGDSDDAKGRAIDGQCSSKALKPMGFDMRARVLLRRALKIY